MMLSAYQSLPYIVERLAGRPPERHGGLLLSLLTLTTLFRVLTINHTAGLA